MMVTFVSQCEKKALNRTRRVLDSFANRIGDNTWQTVITNEGLNAIKKLLRKTASKNTAVSCHWIRSRSRSQFLWVVGNRDKFNEQGVVPVNYTENEIDRFMDKGQWQTLDVIKYAAAIAGLFHDFGKATVLFQDKVNPDKKTKSYEPYRHEWVSFRLYQAFVVDQTDQEWIDALSDIDKDFSLAIYRDGANSDGAPKLDNMPPFAQLVAWLIVTHHKLPVYPAWKAGRNSPPSLKDIDEWLAKNFNALWNSPACKDDDEKERINDNLTLKELPFKSMQWRSRACDITSGVRTVFQNEITKAQNWLHEQLFTTHLSRLCLILADHFYSSRKIEQCEEKWRNPHYKVYANTDRVNGKKVYKQQLDEHLIGVAHYAEKIAKALPRLNSSLPILEPGKKLTGNVLKDKKQNFGWQDNARKLAEKIGKETVEHGFFGINMASTGKGKTRANAKIMAALGRETGRVRFSVALGLRVLTLQTGKEFQNKLKISDDDLAIAVGGIAVKQLFEKQQEQSGNSISNGEEKTPEAMGSESCEEMLDPDIKIHYSGKAEEHSLHKWTKPQKRLDDLLVAPVLVSTIDHLIPATEATKGGHHIPAMLRLITSDLVLDEPDDYGLSDLPALCRLVHWAGMLGSRVLLSTATMPPALTFALFQAYQAGWSEYAKANLVNWDGEICCAWFDERRDDEKSCISGSYKEFEIFKKAHETYIKKRIDYLKSLDAKRKAEILTISNDKNKTDIQRMGDVIQKGILDLDRQHRENNKEGSINDKTLSIGLVRMANIDPMIAVAKYLLEKEVPEDICIYYCIYHSRYPLAIRSCIEQKLDRLLNRKKPEAIWKQNEILHALNKNPEAKHHIFVVLASPVAEVGRDHDYDWAIVEPSSMRSIIQLAGRVLRHRDIIPKKTNILLLQKNKKALAGKPICFNRPGNESAELKMCQHDLFEILNEEQYEQITALQRIVLPKTYRTKDGCYLNLVELEHKALATQLFDKEKGARLFWENHPHWCGEVQRQQRFRDSKKDEAYYLCLSSEYSRVEWKWLNEAVSPPEFGSADDRIKNDSWDAMASRNYFWFDLNAKTIYQKLAKDFKLELSEVSRRFGEVRIVEFGMGTDEYKYHPCFGVYQDIGG